MSYFFIKNKKSLCLFILVFIYLFFYDFFLIGHLNDFTLINDVNDISKLYSLHPYLPLSRIIKNLYNVQYFDKIGFKEICLTFTYVVSSLSIFDLIFLVVILILIYQFCFHQDYYNTLSLTLLASHLVVFLIHITYSAFKFYNCLVFLNVSITNSMMQVRSATIIALILYSLILIGSFYLTILPILKRKNYLKNK